ncbi:farnesyl pyrophosphate synthase-like isoform X2 [Photinus pyralis]|uniref:farnesyl pyrophosphate synthase-like isoform X2 n=1 Tax=Photinus pyralis TaxID=7054 RepID=UPI0012670598|nr:farnesyl pyrophosphate synthase-like isoform X2 [Photinus pyralis]
MRLCITRLSQLSTRVNLNILQTTLRSQQRTHYWSSTHGSFSSQFDSKLHETSIDECMPCFVDLTKTLTTMRTNEISDAMERYAKTLIYNVPRGKKIRVRATVTAYKLLESAERLTPENLRLAHIIGWCIEMMNAAILIEDDIMDASLMRRGAPCWYLVEGIGMRALTDASLIENSVYDILKTHFSNQKCYIHLVELFRLVMYFTGLGQALDTLRPATKNGRCDLDFYSEDKYKNIVKYKTHYYTCEFPVRVALYLTGKLNHEEFKPHFDVLFEMSYFFQLQNDFLDCFGNSGITGKEGTDIQEGKCTWLIMTAVRRANASQRRALSENYGKRNTESVRIVRNLYEELMIPKTYFALEDNVSNLIYKRTREVSNALPDFLIYKMKDMMCKKVSNYTD